MQLNGSEYVLAIWQTLLSSGAFTQPATGSQLSAVQAKPSLQLMGVPAHSPVLQMSLFVHALPSLQPALLGTCAQPLTGSQLSVVQSLSSLHGSVPCGTQVVAVQISPVVQTSPSSQLLPLFCGANLQAPSAGSHVFKRQSVSCEGSHVTAVIGLTLQTYGADDLAQ